MVNQDTPVLLMAWFKRTRFRQPCHSEGRSPVGISWYNPLIWKHFPLSEYRDGAYLMLCLYTKADARRLPRPVGARNDSGVR